jgi:hypothetical protein
MQAGAMGVRSASWIMLRLPHEVARCFANGSTCISRSRRQSDAHRAIHARWQGLRRQLSHPDEAARRLGDLIRTRFRLALRRAGITQERLDLDCSQFRAPSRDGQMDLF